MVEFFKKLITIMLRTFGLKIISSPNSGFENLLRKKRYQKFTVNLTGAPFKVADSVSFYYSHREIFIDEIYKFRCEKNNPVILDCGSNYGTSILYFKSIYPNAIITGIEADPDIYQILKKNIDQSNFNDINLLNKAISNEKKPIQFFSEGADGGRTYKLNTPRQTYEVETIDIDELINEDVDFLKMDIEGAETDVLCNSKKLGKVKQMFIEYHSFEDDKQKLGELLSCLSENNFRYYIHTQFCSKRPLIETQTQLGMDLQLNIFAKRN